MAILKFLASNFYLSRDTRISAGLFIVFKLMCLLLSIFHLSKFFRIRPLLK